MIALVGWVWAQDWEAARRAIEDAYRDRRYDEAVRLIRAAADTAPEEERPALRFLQGAALNRLARPDEALTALDAAASLGFAGPELDLERGIALAHLDRDADARAALERARDAAADDAVRSRAESELRRLAQREGRRKPRVRARPLYGFDSNLAGVAERQALAREVRRRSPYLGAEGSLELPLLEHPRGGVRLTLETQAKHYTRARDRSFLTATARLDAHRALRPRLRVGATAFASDAWTRGDGRYWHTVGAGPQLGIALGRGASLDLWALCTRVTTFVDAPNPQDRDGTLATAGAGVQLPLGTETRASLAVTGTRARTQGDDYDHNAVSLEANLTLPRLAGLEITLAAEASRAFYLHPNSLTRFARRRRDTTTSATLSVSRPIEGWPFVPNVTVRRSRASSNLAAFDFGRWEITAGFGWPAAAWSRQD